MNRLHPRTTPLPRRRLASGLAGLVAAAALCATLAGCGAGKLPPTTVWRLRTPEAQASSLTAPRQGLRMGLGRFSSMAELRTTSLVWRSDEGRQMHRYPYEEWSDYPDRMLEELMLAALSRAPGVGFVARTPPVRGLDGVLSCRVVDFTEWSGDGTSVQVRVAVSWRVDDPTDQAVLGAGIAEEREDVAERSVRGVVEAFEIAARRLSERVTGEAAAACASLASRP